MRATLVSLVLVSTALGCASAAMNLQRASARAILPTPNPDSVAVSDVHRGVLIARWIATTRTGVYDCTIEANEHVAICAKREGQR